MKQLPLKTMTARCPTANAVLLALLSMAACKGKPRIFTTRKAIGTSIGVHRLATLSKAIGVLKDCGIIKCTRKSKKLSGGTWGGCYLEITIGNIALSALSVSLNLPRDVALIVPPERGTSMGKVAINATCSLRESRAAPSTEATVAPVIINPIQQARDVAKRNALKMSTVSNFDST